MHLQGVCYMPLAFFPHAASRTRQVYLPLYHRVCTLYQPAPCGHVVTHSVPLACTVSCFISPHDPSCMSLYTQACTPAGKPPLPNRCVTYRSTCHLPHVTFGFGSRERFRPQAG